MFRRLRNLFAKSDAPVVQPVAPFDAPLAPDAGFFAIGDVHGHSMALEALLARMEALDPEAPRVFVGDYVDRGEDSARVLQLVHDAQQARPEQVICLRGNHEAMMLSFLDDPEASGQTWLQYGGLQTLASFRVGRPAGASLTEVRDALADAMGPALIDWLRARPTSWVSGNVAVVHAAADPELPISLQSESTLLWGCDNFQSRPRTDGVWVVHGHTIVDAAKAEAGRISIDTGAYATGILTAAHVTPGAVSFVASR